MNPMENDESLDLLLFQYVEGELTADQTRQLEMELATNATLQEELNAWRAAFVEADYYDTRTLEEKLLVKPAGWFYARSSTWVFVLLLVASWFRLSPEPTEYQAVIPVKPSSASPTLVPFPTTTIPMESKKSPEFRSPTVVETQRVIVPEILSFERTKPAPAMTEIQPLEPKRMGSIDSLEAVSPHLAIHITQAKAGAQPKKLTRQQQRQIIRLKEQARQQRQANEFMKGNVPYVVPLHSTNF